MTQHMEALVWTANRKMEVRQVPVPDLAEGEALVEILAAGVCGSDVHGFYGQNSLRKPPLIMGHEASGRVAAVKGGPWRVGQRVTFNPIVPCGSCDRCHIGRDNLCRKRALVGIHRPGAFARFVAIPASRCYEIPDSVSNATAALTEPLACGVRTSVLGEVTSGKTVLVLGSGLIGLCCLAAAKAVRADAIAISDIVPKRLEIARRWGAKRVIDARSEDVTQAFPGGADVVIDAVGSNATRDQAIRAVVPGGRVVFIGLHDEASPVEANFVIRQEITIVGSFAYTSHEFARALELLKQGLLRPSADWLQERPLREGPEVFTELADGKSPLAKVMLTFG